MPVLGVIADDFTGATDIAGTLSAGGMRVFLAIGAPGSGDYAREAEEYDAVVVAVKSRSIPPAEAVAMSRGALSWLQQLGIGRFYFKYCSTFDSTPAGNIGTVSDALMDDLGAAQTIFCPAYPVNGRTVYMGNLFVGEQLLSESPMKDHPLNPMRDSNLVRLLAEQSRRRVALVRQDVISAGAEAVRAAMAKMRDAPFIIVDTVEEKDLTTLAEACFEMPLLTGGAGLARELPGCYHAAGLAKKAPSLSAPRAKGRAVILCGSCSEATRRQIALAKKNFPAFKLEMDAVSSVQAVAGVLEWAKQQPANAPLLIYSSTNTDEVTAAQARYGQRAAGEMVEKTLGEIAGHLVKAGADKVIVAGGETSGAVTNALNIRALKICAEIAPGVPWTESLSEPRLVLALKSGNFGGDDFFADAINMLL